MAIKWRRTLFDISKIAIAVIAIGFLAFTVVDQWGIVRPLIAKIDSRRLLFAFVTQLGAFLFFPIPSLILLRAQEPKFDYTASARIFFISQLTKYLPGSLWVFPTRALLIQKAGFSLGSASLTLLFETGAFVATALATSLIGVAKFASPYQSWASWIAFLAALGFIGVALLLTVPHFSSVLIRWQKKAVPTKAKKMQVDQTLKTLTATYLSLGAAWLLSGASLFWLFESVQAKLSIADFPFLMAAFSFAWAAGFVVVISPGGIGVRDAMLIAILGNVFASPIIALVVLLSRILWSLCELVLYIFFTFVIFRIFPVSKATYL